MSRRLVLACAILLALVSACGNGSGQSADPVAVITLAIPDPSNMPSLTRAEPLSVGQTIAVHVQHADSAGYWQQVNPGNPAVLATDGPATTTSDCPSGKVGCGSTTEQLYRAVKSGSSIMEWKFLGLGPARYRSGEPSAPCAGDTGQECPVGMIWIDVEVR